jgi:hypothetical protein
LEEKRGEDEMTTDKRRFGVIEVWRRNAETYHLMIDGQMWSEVEWSPSRQAWCIQDAAGHCLAHVEHIVGENRDVEAGWLRPYQRKNFCSRATTSPTTAG